MAYLNGKKISKKNQLHDLLEYDLDNIVFCDPVEVTIPGSNPPMKNYRINILAKNVKPEEISDEDGNPEMGEFLVTLDRMFSFGVSENIDPRNNKVIGHSISLCLYNKDGATDRQRRTVEKLEEFIQRCKNHILSVRKSIKKPLLEMSDLKILDKFIYWKIDEDGLRVPGVTPTISPKLVEFEDQIVTTFYLEEPDKDGLPREVDPLTFLIDKANKKFKHCYVRPVIKLDSIFIGPKITIQCRITEADVSPHTIQYKPQRLLHRRS